jgi:hypothetical protein
VIRLDHFSLAVKNVYEAADRLRAETGLGFYDGGWTETGSGSRIFPLGNKSYLQVEGIVDVYALQDTKNEGLQTFYKQVAGGDRFRGFAMGVDSLADLQKIAAARNLQPPTAPKGGRILPDGHKLLAAGVGSTAELWSKGLPIWNFFPDMTTHPSGQPVVASPGLRKPLGIAWIEVGGSDAAMTQWLGQPAASFNIRCNGKAPGLYKVAVATETSEIVIERKPISAP